MFMIKRKRYQFSVDLILHELSSVPFITGLLFAKIRLLDDRSLNHTTVREEVKEHCVKWNTHIQFNCKMTANSSNVVLDSKYLRISIRKDAKGGRSFSKLGFVDIDLAEFAGSGLQNRRYLLEGYDTKHNRQDNSTLLISIEMSLLTGDPLFKRPSRSQFYTTTTSMEGDVNLTADATIVNDTSDLDGTGLRGAHINHSHHGHNLVNSMLIEPSSISISNDLNAAATNINAIHAGNVPPSSTDDYSAGSLSSGFGSLPRAPLTTTDKSSKDNDEKALKMNTTNDNNHRTLPGTIAGGGAVNDLFEHGHSRNSSTISQKSNGASVGYGSLQSHSRQGSTDSGKICRNPSSASALSDSTRFNSTERKQKVERSLMNKAPDSETRVESTRVDENNFVDVVFKEILNTSDNFNDNRMDDDKNSIEDGNLHIRYEKDGRVTLSSTSKGSALISKIKQNSKEVTSNSSRQSSSEREGDDSRL